MLATKSTNVVSTIVQEIKQRMIQRTDDLSASAREHQNQTQSDRSSDNTPRHYPIVRMSTRWA